MKKLTFTVLALILTTQFCFSIDTVSTKYYPLKVGNSWTYVHFHYGFPSETYRYKVTILGTSVVNGHLYYSTSGYQLRIDSTYGRLLKYTTTSGCQWLNNEMLQDSLCSRLHDSCYAQCGANNSITRCTDTLSKYIFGLQRLSKTFTLYYFEHAESARYIKDIGPSYHFLQMGGPYYYWDTLQGCVINGIVYGDTSLTGINKISNEVPETFSLSQNYPNPFNPTTKIKFSIPNITPPLIQGGQGGLTTLTIFDILGREVATLVNEKLSPGTYEVEFDGSNYSSGVYFYKLITTEFSETRKMVLIK
jgi:hypothetical protein